MLLALLTASLVTVPAQGRTAPMEASARASGRPITFDGWGGLRLGMIAKAAWKTGPTSRGDRIDLSGIRSRSR